MRRVGGGASPSIAENWDLSPRWVIVLNRISQQFRISNSTPKDNTMTISRRTLLSSGGAFLTAATLSVPTFALAGSGAGKVNVQDISITVVSEGDGAPKPIQIKVPDWKWDYLQLSEIII
jgi:hypothetical protein